MNRQRYLLDTTEIIAVLRGHQPTADRIKKWVAGKNELGVCSIVVSETMDGTKPEKRDRVTQLLRSFVYHPVTLEIAVKAGEYVYDCARRGLVLSLADATIAAVAATKKLVLVTGNPKHFPLPDVVLFTGDGGS